jgi:regulator of RNase E activity RraA
LIAVPLVLIVAVAIWLHTPAEIDAATTSINHYKFVSANQKIICGGVEVNPGDIIFTDEDGVVVVTQAEAQKVLEKARQLDLTEHSMCPFIEKYKSVRKAVEEFGRI